MCDDEDSRAMVGECTVGKVVGGGGGGGGSCALCLLCVLAVCDLEQVALPY